MLCTENKPMTYLEWLNTHYGYKGTEDEVEEKMLYLNRRMVDEIYEEEWCTRYRSAELYVLKLFEEEYLADCEANGWQRQAEKFWWE